MYNDVVRSFIGVKDVATSSAERFKEVSKDASVDSVLNPKFESFE